MADSFLDHIPSTEREKIRKRLRSPEAYEALREKVKGPEDLEREMRTNENLAELHFGIETQPEMKDALKKQLEKDIREQGMDSVLESMEQLDDAVKKAMEEGKFDVSIETDKDDQDRMYAVPEGNIQEKIPVQTFLAEKYASQMVAPEEVRLLQVSVNGKFCVELQVPSSSMEPEIVEFASRHPAVTRRLAGHRVRSHVYGGAGELDLRT